MRREQQYLQYELERELDRRLQEETETMAAVRMTPRQARKYSFTGEQKPDAKPQKTSKPAQEPLTVEKPLSIVIPAIGQKWRVVKGLRDHFCTPPPVGTVFTVWYVSTDGKRIWMEGEEFSLSVTSRVLREYFEREETETP